MTLSLSVLLPIYNEEQELGGCLEGVLASPVPCEIIAVDDCSSDSSPQILRQFDDPRLRIIRHQQNCGKGGAIQTALRYATGDMVIIQDADTEYDPRDYASLLAAINEPSVRGRPRPQVAYGVRDTSRQPVMGHMGNQFLTWVTNILCGTNLRDMETCYKLVPTGLMRDLNLRSRGFEIEPEITVKLARRHANFVQVPISYTPRKEKKLRRVRDGLKSLVALINYRFSNV